MATPCSFCEVTDLINKTKAAAIIVAAGQGKRFGGATLKQFIEIGGKYVLRHTLEKFAASDAIAELIVVVPPSEVERIDFLCKGEWNTKKLRQVVAGGLERHDSVWAGLQAVSEGVELVAIHDGVRPFVSLETIRIAIEQAEKYEAVAVGVTPKDTIKQVNGEAVVKTLDRSTLIAIQTPQVFRKNLILRAHKRAMADGFFSTDDAALVERLGQTVRIVAGDYRNIKITSPDDLLIAEALLRQEMTECG